MNDDIYYMLTSVASKFWNAMNDRDYYYGVDMIEQARESEKDALSAGTQMMDAIDKITYRPIGDGPDPFDMWVFLGATRPQTPRCVFHIKLKLRA